MSRVADILNKWRGARINKRVNDEESEVLFSDITYKELINTLKNAEITHFEILQDLLDIVMAHLSVGISVYLDGGGPEIPENTLQLEAGASLVELIKNILESQAMLGSESHFSPRTKL